MKLSDNPDLKKVIFDRLEEIGWKSADLLKDAEERNYPINGSRLTKWKKGKSGALNDDNIIWIMERLGIPYNVNFGVPVINNGKLNYVIPKYDELKALRRLNILFNNGKEGR